jgi:hypothetical protein
MARGTTDDDPESRDRGVQDNLALMRRYFDPARGREASVPGVGGDHLAAGGADVQVLPRERLRRND